MSIRVNKCRIMVFGEDFNPHSNTNWTLQGQEVLIVNSYTYLGIEIHNDLDLNKSAKAISKRTNRAIIVLRLALVNNSIPVSIKILMLKVLIIPITV